LAFAVFLSLMKKKFKSTFWSMETGNEWIQAFFIHGGSDDVKKNILKFNRGKWKSIAPQVKEWVKEGWMAWERDKPVWFDDNVKARLPADWVPKEGKAEHMKARERSVAERGRKGSVMYESAKQLVSVMGDGDAGGEELRGLDPAVLAARLAVSGDGGGSELRRGSRVQPVLGNP
jgi:hypothetical protein